MEGGGTYFEGAGTTIGEKEDHLWNNRSVQSLMDTCRNRTEVEVTLN
jgi:hypothetical protein